MKKNLKNYTMQSGSVRSLGLQHGIVQWFCGKRRKSLKQESVLCQCRQQTDSITGITVSDWLKSSDAAYPEPLKDSSSLDRYLAMSKGNETFSNKTEQILSWNTSGQDIYYQGKTDKKLPVSMKITYKLDGKEIAAKDLPGKSGKVEIHVTIYKQF
ncbi:MAG: hypothetical protein ACLTJ5_11400 [Clostridium sp.]